MENFSEILKRQILERRHAFIYGAEKEREKYLKELARVSYTEEGKKAIPIYTNFEGLKDSENKTCEEWRLNSVQNNYFELSMTSLIFERLKKELNEEELEKLEVNLKRLFHDNSITNFNILEQELKNGTNAYREFYNHYRKTGELNDNLVLDLKILFVLFDLFLPNLKKTIPSISNFLLILDTQNEFGVCFTKVVNTYISSRSNGYLNIKVACENQNIWKNYTTINEQFVQYVHDYDIIEMDEWRLKRDLNKKE